MNKTVLNSLYILAFILGFIVVYRWTGISSQKNNNDSIADQSIQQESTQKTLETKTDDQASVNVVITPLEFSREQWKFDVGMNTHSVELDQDMTKVVTLIDDQGKEYKPVAWDGPTSGHHREGVLTFSTINQKPKSIELRMVEIGGVTRTFNWQL